MSLPRKYQASAAPTAMRAMTRAMKKARRHSLDRVLPVVGTAAFAPSDACGDEKIDPPWTAKNVCFKDL